MQWHPKFNRHSVLLSGRVSPGLSGTTPGRPCNANNVDILRIGLLSCVRPAGKTTYVLLSQHLARHDK